MSGDEGDPERPYRAFLLRWWQEGNVLPADPSSWRFSLEEVGSQAPRRGFTSLGALRAFLEIELAKGGGEPAKPESE